MSPDIIGVILGVAFILPTIYLVRLKQFDDLAWPLFIASLPVWYMLFGVLALNGTAILKELLFGIPFLLVGLLAWRISSRLTQMVLGIAWISHGFYDYYHDLFFVNPGVFSWYPAFCAVVDIAVGSYLLAFSRRHTAIENKNDAKAS